jgi:hypothetical protein
VGLKVTWEPVDVSDETMITKKIRLNPDLVPEDGITWDSDVLNPKGVAGPARKSTPADRTRSSAKRDGKVSFARKPATTASSAGGTPRTRSKALQEEFQPLHPKFRIGKTVLIKPLATLSGGTEPWREGVVTNFIHPRPTNSWQTQKFSNTVLVDSLVDDGELEEVLVMERKIVAVKDRASCKNGSKKTILVVSLLNILHDLHHVGIDTCSAVSVSTERKDFAFIDESLAAKESDILRGVGGENKVIGGRGPMAVQAKDSNGNDVGVVLRWWYCPTPQCWTMIFVSH